MPKGYRAIDGKPSGQGGARPGAGRARTGRVKWNTKIHPEILHELRRQAAMLPQSQVEILEEGMRKHLGMTSQREIDDSAAYAEPPAEERATATVARWRREA